MRASSNVVAGCFFGGEIEPGTFHAEDSLGKFAPGDHIDANGAVTSGDLKPADTAPSSRAPDATEPEGKLVVPMPWH